MGRELKRVPLDFVWPRNKVWKGYICPYKAINCSECEQSGYNPETKKLYDAWYSFDKVELVYPNGPNGRCYNKLAWCYNLDADDVRALIDANRLWDFTRVPRTEEQREIVRKEIADGRNSWLPENNGYIPTPEEVNEWSRTGSGHDGVNTYICVKARAKKLGVYGLCPKCGGEGEFYASEEEGKLVKEWERTEPPTGDGFQLWETTSEGSPASPVFKTLDELCEWCEDNATTFASFKASKEKWREMLNENFVQHQEGNLIFI